MMCRLRRRKTPMTIKHKIVWNSVGSALLVAAVGLLSAVSMLRIGNTLRKIEMTESACFRDAGQLGKGATAALPGKSPDLDRGAMDAVHGLQVAQDRVITSVRLLIAAAAFGIIVSLSLGSLVGMPLASRLAQLRDAAVEVGKGRRQGLIKAGSGDEIGELATAFNEMSEGVRLARDKAWESDWKFQEMAAAIRDVFWVSDATFSKIDYVSPAYEEVWGRSRESLYNHPLSFADAIVPEDRPRVLGALESMATLNEEYRIVRPDGTMRWIHASGYAIRNQIGKVLRIVGISADVTQRRTAEDSLRLANAELERRVESPTAGARPAKKDSV
jgi:PAS domain S-box-containing protein